MKKAAIEARKAYMKAWRKKNPDKVKKHQETYWTKKAAELKNISAPASDTPQGVEV